MDSIAFGVMLLVAGWGMLRDPMSILMQNTPQGVHMTEICRQLYALRGVQDVHHAHAWTLAEAPREP